MTDSQLILGRPCADEIDASTELRVRHLLDHGVAPGLALVMMGEDPASHLQVNLKKKAAESLGLYVEKHVLPEMASQPALEDLLRSLSGRQRIHGVFVQIPLPRHINRPVTGRHLTPEKDIDLYSLDALGAFYLGNPHFHPCLPLAVMRLLRFNSIRPEGARVALIGEGLLAAQPLALMLQRARATVTTLTIRSPEPRELLKEADIIILCVDQPGWLRWEMVPDGAVVIDLGQNVTGDRVTGDADFRAVKERCSAITPVPGGIGPVIVSTIVENCVLAAERLSTDRLTAAKSTAPQASTSSAASPSTAEVT